VTPFSERCLSLIAAIPPGQVATYGQIALLAGSPRGARQVSRLLHSCSQSRGLPWHRVVAAGGRVALPGAAGDEQRARLAVEGIGQEGGDRRVDLGRFGWPGPERGRCTVELGLPCGVKKTGTSQ